MATDDFSGLERVLDQLVAVYTAVARKRAVCEGICEDCRLLLKPWPKKIVDHGQKSDSTKTNAVTVEKTPLSNEVKELNMIDKALAKVEKARKHCQAKITEESVQIGKKVSPPSDKTSCKGAAKAVDASAACEVPTESDVPAQLSEVPACKTTQNVSKKQINRRDISANSQGVISETALRGIVAETAPAPVATSAPRGGRSASARGTKYKPAHQTAPFQTKSMPVRHVKHPTATRPGSRRTLGRESRTSQSVSLQRSNTADRLKPTGSRASLNSDVSNSVRSEARMLPVDTLIENQPSVDVAHWVNTVTDSSLADGSSDVRLAGGDSSIIQESAAAEKPQMPAFVLQRDGCKLKLPKDFSKALARNRHLRQEIRSLLAKVRPRKLRQGESSAENFVSLLNDHIADQCSPLMSEVLDEVNFHCDTYDWLLGLLADVQDVHMLEICSWQHAVRSRTTLAFVLSEFADMEESFHNLLCRLPHVDTKISGNWNARQPTRSTDILSKWLPAALHRGFPALTATVHYRNQRQLAKYTALVHEVQLLLLQRHVLLEAGQHAINLLHEMDPTDRSFSCLYRATYSLLSTFGQHFPTTVKAVGDV